ncbi:MAG: sialidase family protein, partial [Planctomycetota bacterium]
MCRSQKLGTWNVVAAFLLVSVVLPAQGAAEDRRTGKPVFKMDTLFVTKGDHKETRLPKIVVTNDGMLIAFAGLSRFYRTSTDKGETWSDVRNVSPNCEGGNVVYDRISGDLLILDPDPTVLAWRSQDVAKTWNSEKVVFRHQGHDHGGTMGSEAGITLMHGKHKGRLILPARFSFRKSEGRRGLALHYNTVYFSDDRGKTWREGDPVQSGTGEAAVAELSDGSLYMNSRSHMSSDDRRRIAWSYDGGATFVDWSASDELFETSGTKASLPDRKMPSYGTSAGLARMPSGSTKHDDVLLFSIANEGLRYKRGSVPKTENVVEWTKMIVMASVDR